MSDERKRAPKRRSPRSDPARDQYDRRVRQAICFAEWTSRWSAHAASLSPNSRRGGIATAWIRVRRPKPRLLSSLARLGHLLGGNDVWYLASKCPAVDSPFVLERSSKTIIRSLSSSLQGEAEFEAIVIPSQE
jgi:hypothetical protein